MNCIQLSINDLQEKKTKLVSKFGKFYRPSQKLVINKSPALFKGTLVINQCIPSKRHRFGMKLFVLCDCETRISLGIIVYTGTKIIDISKDNIHGVSGATVKKLLTSHLNSDIFCTLIIGTPVQVYQFT